jgi:hypothetical protein
MAADAAAGIHAQAEAAAHYARALDAARQGGGDAAAVARLERKAAAVAAAPAA